LLTATWIAGCGRFDLDGLGQSAAPPIDAPGVGVGGDAGLIADIDAAPPAPQLSVTPMLAFATPCGASPVAAPLMITNTGTAGLKINSGTFDNELFSLVDSFPPEIAPGESVMINIMPPMAVVGTDRGGLQKTATLTLETNAGTQAVMLIANIKGANIDVSAQTVSFRATNGSCPVPQTITITNSGTDMVAFFATATSGVAFASASSWTVQASGSTTMTLRPTICGSASGFVSFELGGSGSGASGALCSATPVTVTLQIATNSGSGCACS
jgi:hypothetical protein